MLPLLHAIVGLLKTITYHLVYKTDGEARNFLMHDLATVEEALRNFKPPAALMDHPIK